MTLKNFKCSRKQNKMKVLVYLKKKYHGFVGVPVHLIQDELLSSAKPPKNMTFKSAGGIFVSFEWIANKVQALNS